MALLSESSMTNLLVILPPSIYDIELDEVFQLNRSDSELTVHYLV